MIKKWIYGLSLLITSTACIFSADLEEQQPNPKDIRIVPVDPTPEGDNVAINLMFPSSDQIIDSSPIKIQVRLEGFPLGTDSSEFFRRKEVYNSTEGQSLHVIIDNHSFFEVSIALIDELDNNEEYFDQTAEFEIPFKIPAGAHTIRIFPARSFGESLKGNGCFVAREFYFKSKKPAQKVDLDKPYLTYNLPQGNYKMENKPLLLDFYITNCQLSKDGYKVKVIIDGENQRTVTQWTPYYIYGLKKGLHKIRLQLLDPENKLVPGPFNDVEKTFSLY